MSSGIFLKWAFGTCIVLALFKFDVVSADVLQHIIQPDTPTIVAFACFGISAIAAAARWGFVLAALSVTAAVRDTARISFIALFFNVAIPGSVSGDAAKVTYLVRGKQCSFADASTSVLVDRILGLATLMSIALIGFLIQPNAQCGLAISTRPEHLLGVIFIAALVIYFSRYVTPNMRLRAENRISRAFGGKMKLVFTTIRKIRSSISVMLQSRAQLAMSVAASLTGHFFAIAGFTSLVSATPNTPETLLSLTTAVPVGLLVAAFPVAPAGMGTGHLAFEGLFSACGLEAGADTFTIFVAFQFALAAIGALLFMFSEGNVKTTKS